MDDPEAIKVEPHRQRAKPAEIGRQFTNRNLSHGLGVLIGVLLVVGPEVAPGLIRVRGVEGQGVEFVVTHDGQGGTGIYHGPDDVEGFPDQRAAVDEVAEKDGLTFWVPVDALVLGITQLPEEPLEGVSVAVCITDEVVHDGWD
jgi:hypothetical protein